MTPKKLLAALAPYEPINHDEFPGCVHCGSSPPHSKDWAGRYLEDHAAGCPWVKARRLLGDKLPASRKTPNVMVNGPPWRVRST